MNRLRRLFSTPLLSESIVTPVLTGIGVFTFLAGIFYLPSLGPTRMESFLFMLLLAIFALLCATLGQLLVVAQRLEQNAKKQKDDGEGVRSSEPS